MGDEGKQYCKCTILTNYFSTILHKSLSQWEDQGLTIKGAFRNSIMKVYDILCIFSVLSN